MGDEGTGKPRIVHSVQEPLDLGVLAVCEFGNQPQNKSSQTFRKWFWHQKRMLNPKHFLIMVSFKNRIFVTKNVFFFLFFYLLFG
jgi:hypothetical protein